MSIYNFVFQTGPVRLFVPYKRRKKDSESGPGGPLSPAPTTSPQFVAKKQRLNSTKTPTSSSMIPATLTPVSIGKDHGKS